MVFAMIIVNLAPHGVLVQTWERKKEKEKKMERE